MDELDEWGLPMWPAAERNKQPIFEELSSVLPTKPHTFLELAAGTGQHAVFFAERLSHATYYPSDSDPVHIQTLAARVAYSRLPNLQPPLIVDCTQDDWGLEQVDVIYNANMVHIAPWEAAQGLFRGAGRVLPRGGMLVTYGPYKIAGEHTAESNARFDASLRERDARWGVRGLEELSELGQKSGLALRERRPMPANNFFVVWQRV